VIKELGNQKISEMKKKDVVGLKRKCENPWSNGRRIWKRLEKM
jgi:hypothetical protein